jgi:hypothetical protein
MERLTKGAKVATCSTPLASGRFLWKCRDVQADHGCPPPGMAGDATPRTIHRRTHASSQRPLADLVPVAACERRCRAQRRPSRRRSALSGRPPACRGETVRRRRQETEPMALCPGHGGDRNDPSPLVCYPGPGGSRSPGRWIAVHTAGIPGTHDRRVHGLGSGGPPKRSM